jgi:hypothetical protein
MLAGAVVSSSPAEQYSAAFDVQNGWTRIGRFNTQTIPQSSQFGGMVVGWNRSGGNAETNLYNVYSGAPVSFVFSQLETGGSNDLLSIYPNGAVGMTGSLTVAGDAQIAGNVGAANVNASGGMGAVYFGTTGTSTGYAVSANAVGAQAGGGAYPSAYASNTGFGPALWGQSNSIWASLHSDNATSDTTHITGIYAQVASSSDYGLATNGQINTGAGDAVLTHVPTRNGGHRVVTSPLVLESEVHASGEGRLKQGRAHISLPHDLADAIHHSAAHSYRVQLTPTGHCHGLAVIEKTAEGFRVEELGKGTSEASFDWFLVARRPRTLGSDDLRTLPAALPTVMMPAPPK